MRRFVPYLLGTLSVVLLAGGPALYAYYRQLHIRNFRAVREGVLYRSGQLSLLGLQRVLRDYGIKTVVTLRDSSDPKDPPPDRAEENYCLAEGIHYCRISPRTWYSPDGSVPAEEGVRQFRAVMDDKSNYPVLVHCFAGIHRTGAFCAVYRMEYEHWSNPDAIAEMRACGYRDLDDEWDLLGYLEQYQPRWRRGESPRLEGLVDYLKEYQPRWKDQPAQAQHGSPRAGERRSIAPASDRKRPE
jgi:tyrosine-protein phosphatase SIW14